LICGCKSFLGEFSSAFGLPVPFAHDGYQRFEKHNLQVNHQSDEEKQCWDRLKQKSGELLRG
jgi:hypothetical protein